MMSAAGAARPRRASSMQLQQVRHFLLLCEELSFTRAAQRCGIGQPSLSKSLRALERELGGALFHRRPSPRLSAVGHAVRPYLEQIATASDLAYRAAREVTDARAADRAAEPPPEPAGRA